MKKHNPLRAQDDFPMKRSRGGSMKQEQIAAIYNQLSQTYPRFTDIQSEWSESMLNSTPFESLVSVVLSTMTHSRRLQIACEQLFAVISTPEEVLALDDNRLKALIQPVAHYNRKTKNLKEMCTQLIQRHHGQVPRTREELLALTGVGLKCADIVMNFTYGSDAIAVDTHVHRVLNRTGIVTTKTAEETSQAVNSITPQEYRKHAHEWLIQHGMYTCTARKPKCSHCAIAHWCEYRQFSK